MQHAYLPTYLDITYNTSSSVEHSETRTVRGPQRPNWAQYLVRKFRLPVENLCQISSKSDEPFKSRGTNRRLTKPSRFKTWNSIHSFKQNSGLRHFSRLQSFRFILNLAVHPRWPRGTQLRSTAVFCLQASVFRLESGIRSEYVNSNMGTVTWHLFYLLRSS